MLKTNLFVNRYKFNSGNQKEDKSRSEWAYVASLTKLSPCKFGAFLDDDVRDTVYLCAGFKVQNSD